MSRYPTTTWQRNAEKRIAALERRERERLELATMGKWISDTAGDRFHTSASVTLDEPTKELDLSRFYRLIVASILCSLGSVGLGAIGAHPFDNALLFAAGTILVAAVVFAVATYFHERRAP